MKYRPVSLADLVQSHHSAHKLLLLLVLVKILCKEQHDNKRTNCLQLTHSVQACFNIEQSQCPLQITIMIIAPYQPDQERSATISVITKADIALLCGGKQVRLIDTTRSHTRHLP